MAFVTDAIFFIFFESFSGAISSCPLYLLCRTPAQ